MPTIPKEFIQEAHGTIDEVRQQDQALEQEENKAHARLNEIKELRTKFAKANINLKSYPPSGSEYPCPRCFVIDGIARETKPVPSESEVDIFRCSHCELEIEVKV
ncbi:MAG: hypothetical protein IIA06_08130 [Proteobacteria bacterium]|nr:hypothetical protein [Pseudomonadota bacterium]